VSNYTLLQTRFPLRAGDGARCEAGYSSAYAKTQRLR
jgi:hypothetical protein